MARICLNLAQCALKQGVAEGTQTVGDVALFLSLLAQLFAPLNWFGTYVRMMQQTLVDMENLFELLERNTQISVGKTKKYTHNNDDCLFRSIVFLFCPHG